MSPPGKAIKRTSTALAALALVVACGHAAGELSPCRTASLAELGEAMKAHNQHVYRMNRKFRDVWYFQGQLPAGVGEEVTPATLHRYLALLAPRKTALLFHAIDHNRLCTWLFTSAPGRKVVSHVRALSPADMADLTPSQWQDLGVRSVRRARVADRAAAPAPLEVPEAKQRWSDLLERIAALLVPPPVARRLVAENTDTLIVVPISVRSFLPGREKDDDSATEIRGEKQFKDLPGGTQLVLAVSTVPFLALPLDGRQVVDRMSVVVAPGFFPFARPPAAAHGGITAPLLVGAPVKQGLEPLPGAQAEIEQIAADLKTAPLVGAAALKGRVLDELNRRADALDFILLATHGRASETDPVDRSYLELSDAPLSAREISRLGEPGAGSKAGEFRLRQRPVVIMSACETGLGKSFAVGTIGLARAWQWAGASSVVMSLWSVDDQATRDLMVDLVGRLREGRAVDQALREAALRLRRLDDNPALWAAFNVFGAPGKLRVPGTGGS